MHIYYDYQIFALQKVGGISRYFVELAGRLSKSTREIRTTVLAPVHINEHLVSGSVEAIGRKIREFPGKHRVLPAANRIASSFLLKKKRSPDIFHETYYSKHVQSVRAARVLTVYDMIHERYPEQFTGPDLNIPACKAAAVSRADHIIAISQSTRADLIKYLSVPQDKISVIPLASSLGIFPQSTVQRKEVKPYLLYVGLRQGVKNFAPFFRAYAHSNMLPKDFDLICVGGGPFTALEMRAICSAGLEKKVQHIHADDGMLEKLYGNASLFVYPSLYEGFGLPLLEAMRCGCPVVCSNTGSMPEIAGDAAKYFDPENEEDMRVVMENTAQSEKDRKILRLRGYEREKLFSWERCVEMTANVYRNLL